MAGVLTKADVWESLWTLRLEMEDVHLRDLFENDPGRAARFTVEACDLTLDFSKQLIDERVLTALVKLTKVSGLAARRRAMLAGQVVNETEGRPALHTALRNRSDRPVLVDGEDVMPEVRGVLDRVRDFSESVRGGTWTGFTGERIRDVVNIGIGGSDLGPAMVAAAFCGRRSDIRAHYVSNLDAGHLVGVLRDLDPATTLFVIASKTFGTQETLANAASARSWVLDALGDEQAVARHFVAVSTHRERVQAFGIDPTNMFEFWDWVGGRYSLWSAVGLSIAIAYGMDAFEELLAGAYAMDEHFLTAKAEHNLPVLLGVLGIWNSDFLGISSHAVLPYDWALRLLPAHLQQLEMESNGKRVGRGGEAIDEDTCPVVWGGPGSNGQHAFYQLLHQGTRLVSVDFLLALEGEQGAARHHDKVVANAIAQSEALMRGRTETQVLARLEASGMASDEARRLAPHKVMPGNRPSSMITYRLLTPARLGAIVAMYEHKVFVQSVIWGNNPFDQWGVELGKDLAGRVLEELQGEPRPAQHDASTNALIEAARKANPPNSAGH